LKLGRNLGTSFEIIPKNYSSKLATKQHTKRISGSLSSWRTFIYLGTNYIVFRNIFFYRKKKESDEIFENISLIKMESLKLISYWRNMFGDGQGTMVFEKNRVADYGC
jgi:hypothetical protein